MPAQLEDGPGSPDGVASPVRGGRSFLPAVPEVEDRTRAGSAVIPRSQVTPHSQVTQDSQFTKDSQVTLESPITQDSHDRWHWRRRIRADPRKRAVYRGLVALAGLLLILAGLVTGPLPGPGGIPLVLLGLAVWASEFSWAHRLMQSFKRLLHRFRQWSRPKQTLFWVLFLLGCAGCGWLYLIVLGVPGWAPEPVAGWLTRLPGV